MTKTDQTEIEKPPKGRLITGAAVLIFGQSLYILIPIIAASKLPMKLKAAFTGILLFGIPELFILISVAILGRPGYNYLKSRIRKLFKREGPPAPISRRRYHLGISIFSFLLISAWLMPYFKIFMPFYIDNRIVINMCSDFMLLTSLFILGDNFWDKLRSLFIYDAKVHIPERKDK